MFVCCVCHNFVLHNLDIIVVALVLLIDYVII
uniref:Uncharacterized protein n=1 Tax=Myoviridae sp. ct5hB2 TaxID=2826614 RepID=A0A8S5N7T6_9CAUD|nr:MAG TPA: hypothetical protein [Myoviridae sp. ct5hB2]